MTETLDLDVDGMSCASCASRIQKKINEIPGATGTVNFATHSARVDVDPDSCSTDRYGFWMEICAAYVSGNFL